MNVFLRAAINQIKLHGQSASYITVVEGAYDPNTLSTANTETTRSVTVFPNHVKTSQYSYPNLVGKEVIEFYLANNSLGFTPEIRDKIVWNGTTYGIEGIQKQVAQGEIVLWLLLAVKN